MGDAFTTALKISAVIGCAAILYGPLAVVIFICSLVILTIVIYIYRLIIPQKPIDNEYEIKNMCKEYIKWVISMINKSIPLKKRDKTVCTYVTFTGKSFIFGYNFDDTSNGANLDFDKIKEDMKEQIKPDSTYKLLYVALVYMKSSLVAKYNCPQSKKSYEMTITYEELKELTEPWHEYGQEYKSEWGY